MRRRTVFLLCATIGLGLSEHASAQELPVPLPTLEPDVATFVAVAEATVDVELPTVDVPAIATPAEVDAPAVEPAQPAGTSVEPATAPAEAAPPAQYQAAPPQYQAPAEGGLGGAEQAASDPTPAASAEPDAEPTQSAAVAPNVATPAAPQAWTWNWNWNCLDPPTGTAPPDGASAWSWNWNWNCDPEADPALDLDQYQVPTTQYQNGNTTIFQGGNTAIGIRIASPGDDGPVTQTTSTVTHVATTILTEVEQTIEHVAETTSSIHLPTVPAVPMSLPATIQPPIAFDPPLEAILPPIVGAALPVVVPLPGVGDLVAAGGLGLTSVAGGSSVRVPAATPSSAQPLLGAFDGRAFTIPPALVEPASPRRGRRADGSAPLRDDRFPAWPPVPGGAGAGGGQSASAPGLLLAAFAAALAAYLLMPPLGARPLRRSRDRRRLGLVAAPLEPPG